MVKKKVFHDLLSNLSARFVDFAPSVHKDFDYWGIAVFSRNVKGRL